MQEIWKKWRDSEYEVSNTGYIRSGHVGRILKPSLSRQGYARINAWVGGKPISIAVHRIIAEVFIENPKSLPIVNHIDGNPSNNRVENLEWTTIKENVQHAVDTGLASRGEECTVAKLTEAQVIVIISLIETGISVIDVSRRYGVSAAAISHIWNGKTWKHISRPKIETKNYKGKLKVTDIPVIRNHFKEGLSDNEIAKLFGIHKTSIYNIRVGKNWSNY